MYIKEELFNIDNKIQELKIEKESIIRRFIQERNEKDEHTIIKNYDKLMRLYNNKHPELYDKIIVTCFKIRTSVCCGFGGSMKKITLSNLLKLWSNGYLYEGCPITNVLLTNSGHYAIEYIKDGKIESISDRTKKIDIHPYHNMVKKILGECYTPTEDYSETSVSDLFFND